MNVGQAGAHRGSILVVDDTPNNLRLLSTLLTAKGYEVRAVLNGEMALSMIKGSPPDLILLDICMPRMDGYEVCKRLKADPATQAIPVIFVSALGEVLDKVKAFAAGGVDFITKPFHLAEVLARVETHLMLRRLQHQLQLQNERLQQEVEERQRAEEKYRSIFENCIEGIFQIAPDGHYINANPALAQIYGFNSPEDLISEIGNRHFYARSGRWDELSAYLRHYGEVSDFESQVVRNDGTKIWISENVRAIKDQAGTLLYYEGTVQDITERRQTEAELRLQRQEAERLLLSILPVPIAMRLKRKREIIADSYEDVSVLFADVVNFTSFCARVSPKEVVSLLDDMFSSFDQLAEQYGLEKIKTIGDEYMAVGGLPERSPTHVERIADMALAMQKVVSQFQTELGQPFQLRIGINSGPVVAGVIGSKKFSYDLWGSTVNLASRMQTQGMPGRIQVTETTFKRLRYRYSLEERGSIDIKGLGEMKTYWLKGKQG